MCGKEGKTNRSKFPLRHLVDMETRLGGDELQRNPRSCGVLHRRPDRLHECGRLNLIIAASPSTDERHNRSLQGWKAGIISRRFHVRAAVNVAPLGRNRHSRGALAVGRVRGVGGRKRRPLEL